MMGCACQIHFAFWAKISFRRFWAKQIPRIFKKNSSKLYRSSRRNFSLAKQPELQWQWPLEEYGVRTNETLWEDNLPWKSCVFPEKKIQLFSRRRKHFVTHSWRFQSSVTTLFIVLKYLNKKKNFFLLKIIRWTFQELNDSRENIPDGNNWPERHTLQRCPRISMNN